MTENDKGNHNTDEKDMAEFELGKPEKKKKPFRVVDNSRKKRVGVLASDFEELKTKCKEKFTYDECILVVDEDGIEIDTEYFTVLPEFSQIMILKGDESWLSKTGTNDEAGSSKSLDDKVMALAQQLRKRKHEPSPSLQVNREVSVQGGWMNFNYREAKYKAVKSSKFHPNTGPTKFRFSAEATHTDVLTKMRDHFFPGGKSFLGRAAKFEFKLGTFCGNLIDPETFKIEEYINTQTKKVTRIYLLTKEKMLTILTDSDSSDLELPTISFTKKKRSVPVLPSSSNDNTDTLQPRKVNVPVLPSSSPDNTDTLQSRRMSPQLHEFQDFLLDTPMQVPSTFDSSATLKPSQSTSGAAYSSLTGSPYNPAPLHLDAGTPTVQFNVNSSLCCICMERERNTALDPCGHIFCMVCATAQESSISRTCSLCRKFIKSILKLIN